ncbi:MAG: M48 family metalloprotease [Spirochaetales bacterium]|nr:M48 family metalloprotease [Spirochaetales bacterium]
MPIGLKILAAVAFYLGFAGLAALFGSLALKGADEKQERLARLGRRLSFLRIAGLVLVVLGDDFNPLVDAAALTLATGVLPLFYAAMLAAYLAPLVAFYALMGAVAARYLNRIRGTRLKASAQAARAALAMAALMLTWLAIYAGRELLPRFVAGEPLRFLAMVVWAALILSAVAWLNHALARRSKKRRRDEEARLLPRVSALAARAGVRLSRFVYYDSGEERVANAFASGLFRPTVSVYSHLERNLDPEEFDAIVAHELAHLKGRDEALRTLVASLGIGVFLLVSEAVGRAFELPRALSLAVDLYLIVMFVQVLPGIVYRIQERRADAFAAGLVESPAVTASALRKVYALNDSDGSRQSRKNGTAHPSLRKRLAALGDTGDTLSDAVPEEPARPGKDAEMGGSTGA